MIKSPILESNTFCTFILSFVLYFFGCFIRQWPRTLDAAFQEVKLFLFTFIFYSLHIFYHVFLHISHTLHLAPVLETVQYTVCCWLLIYTLVYISKVVSDCYRSLVMVFMWMFSDTLVTPHVVRLYRLIAMYRLHDIFTLFGQQSTFSLSLLSQMYCKCCEPELNISTDDCRVCMRAKTFCRCF